MTLKTKHPKPFLKWAGGKTQLLNEIKKRLPADLSSDYKYFEPFVGGGAVFFELISKYNFHYAYLGDTNKDLILTYNVIKRAPEKLLPVLLNFKKMYDSKYVDNKKFFYRTRELFNNSKDNFNPLEISSKTIYRAAQMIFLNKTCFNGLYRVNKNGKFNVPFANPKNPLIYDQDNIYSVSEALKNVDLVVADFSDSEDLIDENSFVYLDPPYKPINGKKSFEGYTKEGFDDSDQEKLSGFCWRIHKDKNAKFLLSNSKPNDTSFFNKLYNGFTKEEVDAKRSINSNGNNRGYIEELLIYNGYKLKEKK